MRAFRFLHAADLHLDTPFRGMSSLPSVIRDRIMQSTFLALQRLIELALREKVDFVVISGDIFDLSDRSLRAQNFFQQAVGQLAEKGIQTFVIHGNHDPEDGRRASLRWPETVHFFRSDEVEMRIVYDRSGKELAHIYGISYPTAVVTDNLAKRYLVQNDQAYNIGLLHCNVDGDLSHEHYAPCSKQDLIDSSMDYWALGHIHTRQILYQDPFIVYPGNIQGRNVRELGPKGCYIVNVTDQGRTELIFHSTDVIRWFHESLSIEQFRTEQDLTDALVDHIEQIRMKAEGLAAVVRVTLEGRGYLHHFLQKESNIQELLGIIREQETKLAEQDEKAPFVWVESLKVKTGVEVDTEQLRAQDSFLGDLLRISKELLEDEKELKAFSEQALEALMTHPKARKYLKDLSIEEQQEWLHAAEELAIHLLFEDGEWEQ